MTAVTLRSISKMYGETAAVEELNLEVQSGEFVVLLGPSGCGKTTTLRMIAGFDQPTAGQIFLDSKDITNLPSRLRNIGMVFQNYALFPSMTVGENIAFGLKQRGTEKRKIDARVEEMLQLIQLPDRRDHYCSQLSGGQQQRVALARALSYSPAVLLMDEPLGALDLKLRESMQIELRRLQRHLEITTIFVTHDQQEAMTLADRIVVMSQGRIQQVGKPTELYEYPGNKFVADFIGKNNFFSGKVISSSSGRYQISLAANASVDLELKTRKNIGDSVEFALRPEQIDLSVERTSGDKRGLIGVVDQRQFSGSVVHYFVRLPWSQTLVIERPATSSVVEIGTAVELSWLPNRVTIFE